MVVVWQEMGGWCCGRKSGKSLVLKWAEVSFIPDSYPIPTSPMTQTVEVLLPDGRGLLVSGTGKLGHDIRAQSGSS